MFFKTKLLKLKRPDKNKIRSLIDEEVYLSDGRKIGRVRKIYLAGNQIRIYGWLVEPNRVIRKRCDNKLLLVRHKFMKAIGEVIILNVNFEEELKKSIIFLECSNFCKEVEDENSNRV
jgi:sporulation protein YlmC with PRC-barrel domain